MLPVIPDHLKELLLARYGEETTQAIADGFAAVRPVTMRVNPLKSSMEEVTAQLAQAGIRFERVSWYADALILPDVREDAVRALPVYDRGGVYLQSLSSMLPPLVLGAKAGESLLDMAAAPGGKTTQIAAMTGNGALITACEKDKVRAERLRFNLERQGVRRVTVMEEDARRLSDLFSFERILLDAPCTGSGTIRLLEGEPQRRMDPSWVKKTASVQLAMLRKAMKLLGKGREMVYSTCSILPVENDEVVAQVVRECGCEVIPIDPELTAQLPTLPVTVPGTLCVRPTELFEGFFVARLKRVR